MQFVVGKLKAVVVQESRPDAHRLRASASGSSVDGEEDAPSAHESVDEQMRKSREKIIHTFASLQKILGQLCFCKLPFGSPVVKEVSMNEKQQVTVTATLATVHTMSTWVHMCFFARIPGKISVIFLTGH